jgi:hypothetical protein
MESFDNIFGRLGTWMDSKFPDLKDRASKSQSPANLNMPLRGMKPSTAFRRIIRFARPTFTITMVLSVISLAGSEHVQRILIASFTGLMSLTLIKLFCYIIIVFLGLHLALNQMRSISNAIKQITSFVCDAGFDCTSSTIGVVAGVLFALCIEKGVLSATLSVLAALTLILTMNTVFWSSTNFEFTWGKLSGLNSLKSGQKAIVGWVLVAIGLLFLAHEPWKEIGNNTNVCPPAESIPTCTSFCLNVKT